MRPLNLQTIWKSTVFFLGAIVGAAIVGSSLGVAIYSGPPLWALLLALLGCGIILYATHGIKRDLVRMRCELTGHWPAVFKKYDERGCCPRCGDIVATRPVESDGPGMQLGEDTLFQRIEWLEQAILRIEEKLGSDVPA